MNIEEVKSLEVKKSAPLVVGKFTDWKCIGTNKNGQEMHAGTLTDASGSIDVNCFNGKNLKPFNGKEVYIKKGVREEYKGYPKLNLAPFSSIEEVPSEYQGEAQQDIPAPKSNTPAKKSYTAPKDDDYVPQTLTYMMGDALQATLSDPDADGKANPEIMASYAVAMYKARELAVDIIRKGNS